MAKCRDYERHQDCRYFHKVTDPDERVQVGTSMKKLDQYCFYCFKTERCKKIGAVHSWTGRTQVVPAGTGRIKIPPPRCARPGKRQTMNDSAIVAREKGIFNERNQNQSADP